MTNPTNISATSGQLQQISNVLNRLQLCTWGRYYTYLVWEDWDWLVILQCLQDHNLFRSNPQRPPLKAFQRWVNDNQFPQLLAHCSAESMSYVHRKFNGARYPWNNVKWQPAVLRRWRLLYRHLDKLLNELPTTPPTPQFCVTL